MMVRYDRRSHDRVDRVESVSADGSFWQRSRRRVFETNAFVVITVFDSGQWLFMLYTVIIYHF